MWKECICGSNCDDYLEAFFNSISEGFAFHQIIFDESNNAVDYKFININNAFTAITGLSREDILGKKVSEVIPLLGQSWADVYKGFSLKSTPESFEKYNAKLDKYFKISPIRPTNDQFVIFFNDITDLKKANILMKKYQILLDNAPDIIFYANSAGEIMDANMNAVAKYGYSLEELKTMKVTDLRLNSTNSLFQEQMKEADRGGITFEGQQIKKDGTIFPVEVSVKSVLIDEARLRIHIVRDISERKMAEENILYLANYDSLTGIPNRGNLIRQLKLTLENSRRGNFKFAVMLFDIDKFKSFNDIYGHSCGDLVLKETARIVQNTIRKVDFIARLGGDEFVIIQPYINDAEDSKILAKRIIDELKPPIKFDKTELNVNLSIGISICPDDSTDAEELMSFSDKAMYSAKQISGASFEFYSSIKAK